MDYWIDVVGFLVASSSLSASLTGRLVSVGRGGANKVTIFRSTFARIVLFLVAVIVVAAIIIDIKRKIVLQGP